VNLHDAMTDPRLMGRTFGAPSWAAWRVLAKAVDGAPLTDEELLVFRRLTGRQRAPSASSRRLIAVAGRRSGKTSFTAAMAVHAGFEDYSALLAPGERAVVAVASVTMAAAGVMFGRIAGLIADSPVYSREVSRENAGELELANGNIIAVMTGNFRSVRGRSYAFFALDEACFLRSEESSSPDIELVRAVTPGLTTLHGRLAAISSPWARRGFIYGEQQKHFANDASADVLVAVAPTAVLNPTFDLDVIKAAYASDPISARTEWGAETREDIMQHFPDGDIDSAIVTGRTELPPRTVIAGAGAGYRAFCDPSGGRHDAMVLAIAHAENDRAVLDCLRIAQPPFDPEAVVGQFATTLRSYHLGTVVGDKYAAEWVVSAFGRAGIGYSASERDRSALFVEMLPAFAERRVELLDNARLVAELRGLERRPRPGGRDAVTHGPGGRDDIANGAIGALWLVSRRPAETAIEAGASDILEHGPGGSGSYYGGGGASWVDPSPFDLGGPRHRY